MKLERVFVVAVCLGVVIAAAVPPQFQVGAALFVTVAGVILWEAIRR